MRSQSALTATEVRSMLDAGMAPAKVAQRLVETGLWSDKGAAEIVRFMTVGPDKLMSSTLVLTGPRRRRTKTR
jgi:hypothetical protein